MGRVWEHGVPKMSRDWALSFKSSFRIMLLRTRWKPWYLCREEVFPSALCYKATSHPHPGPQPSPVALALPDCCVSWVRASPLPSSGRSQKAVTICLPPTNILGRKRCFFSTVAWQGTLAKTQWPSPLLPREPFKEHSTVTISAHAQRTLTGQGQQCRQSQTPVPHSSWPADILLGFISLTFRMGRMLASP